MTGTTIPGLRRRRVLVLAAVATVAGLAAAVAVGLSARGGSTSAAPAARLLTGRPPVDIPLPGRPVTGGTAAVVAAAHRRLPAGDLRLRVADAMVAYDPAHRARTAAALRRLPQRAVVTLNLGLALLWAGDAAGATTAWETTKRLDPYGFYGIAADNFLHPEQLRSYPPYLTFRRLGTERAVRAAVRADPRSASAWLDLAVRLQSSDRPAAIAAARRAVELDPTHVSPRVALAVLSFDKDNPAQSVGTLGTLASNAPDNPEIRFHFGLLLYWLKRVDDAAAQWRQTIAADPTGPYGQAAKQFLAKLAPDS